METSDTLLINLERASFIYLGLLIGTSAFLGKTELSQAAAIGGLIGWLNFRYLKWVCSRLIMNQVIAQKSQMVRGWMILKSAFPILSIALAVHFAKVQPLGLLLGVSAIVAVILAYAMGLMLQQLFSPQNFESR